MTFVVLARQIQVYQTEKLEVGGIYERYQSYQPVETTCFLGYVR